MKNKKFIIYILSVLFILISLLVIFNKSSFIDNGIYKFIISFRCSFLDNYFMFITKFGNYSTVLLIIFIISLLLHNKYSLYLWVSSIGTVILNKILKIIIRRERPSILRLIKQGGYSFPSGHAMISICLYGYLLYIVYIKVTNKLLRNLLILLLVIIIISIGISRIYLGVHYASDVLAGYLLSIIYVIMFIIFIDKKV